MNICGRLLILGTLISQLAWADRQEYAVRHFPFGLYLNMDVVYAVTTASSNELVGLIQSYGVDVVAVPGPADKAVNPILADLPFASEKLLKDVDFSNRYYGRMIAKTNPCCSVQRDTIIVENVAPTHVLIHEFLHSAMRIKNANPNPNNEMQILLANHRLNVYAKKLLQDSGQLLNPLWRRDVLSAAEAVIGLMYERFQLGHAQEAIIEKTLATYIHTDHRYYDESQQKFGFEYGFKLINETIDLFNNSDFILKWCRNTVAGYREGIVSGEIPSSEEANLSAEQARQFYLDVAVLLGRMKSIQVEIEALKDFYRPRKPDPGLQAKVRTI